MAYRRRKVKVHRNDPLIVFSSDSTEKAPQVARQHVSRLLSHLLQHQNQPTPSPTPAPLWFLLYGSHNRSRRMMFDSQSTLPLEDGNCTLLALR